MSVLADLTEEEAKLCTQCGCEPRLPGRRSTWCRECKNRWQRGYRAGRRRFEPVPPPVRVDTGCLIWQGSVNPETGYGQQRLNGKSGYAHRFAWEAVHGPIPVDLTVDHICEVKVCVDVDHLQLVTRGRNAQLYYERRTS